MIESLLKREKKWERISIRSIILIAMLMLFFVSIQLMELAVHNLGAEMVSKFIEATSNPFTALFIGLFSTAILQSSSTTTALVVTLVASGSLSLSHAIPIVMGANLGTTITGAIVSLSHINRKKEFRKAVATASVHFFFNAIVLLLFFPIENYTHFLSNVTTEISHKVFEINLKFSSMLFAFLDDIVDPIAYFLYSVINYVFSFGTDNVIQSLVAIVVSITLLFYSIAMFKVILSNNLVGESRKVMDNYFFGTPLKSLTFGTLVTATLQSSSVTTSLVVPLVGTGKLTIRKALPFIMGANIGTTITALIASISKSEAALSIALVHVLFNLLGVMILFPIPIIRNIPVELGKKLGALTAENKLVGFSFFIFAFFIIPFLLIYFY